ncbi:hypothetical protein ACOKM3_01940 [Streptomyces sp. BH106]|uniref:COG4705 family protein n=1 Tax=Streptomyces sp. BH106 TaxID=3410409 RepID=UPI003CE75B1A
MSAVFWITKVLTTGMGESASDFLAVGVGPAPAVALSVGVLAAFLVAQYRSRRYVAGLYWGCVVMVSVVGTMVADFIHVIVGVPYVTSTVAFAVLLAAVFAVWYATERSLTFHDVRTRRRETFYWLAVMATFALGTAVGDLVASTSGIGYFDAGLLFALLIALPAVGHRWFRLNGVAAFWCAYVVTRPLGASFADWAAASPRHGGLGFGAGPVSIALLVVIAAFVGFLSLARREGAPGRARGVATESPVGEPTLRG